MPKDEKMVDLDTSGEGAEINLEEKETTNEEVVEDNSKSNDTPAESGEQLDAQENTKQEEVKEESKKEDDKLEDYSKGVQARIAKLTRKMREAERQRDAATEYAKSVEEKRKALAGHPDGQRRQRPTLPAPSASRSKKGALGDPGTYGKEKRKVFGRACSWAKAPKA